MNHNFSNNYHNPIPWDLTSHGKNYFDIDHFRDWMQYCYDGTTNRCCDNGRIQKIVDIPRDGRKYDEHEGKHYENRQDEHKYCNISDIVDMYNAFLMKYVDDVNTIIDEYNDVIESISSISISDGINGWMNFIQKKFDRIGKIEKLEYYIFSPGARVEYECDEAYEIAKMIRDDIISKRNFLRELDPQSIDMEMPNKLWELISRGKK